MFVLKTIEKYKYGRQCSSNYIPFVDSLFEIYFCNSQKDISCIP